MHAGNHQELSKPPTGVGNVKFSIPRLRAKYIFFTVAKSRFARVIELLVLEGRKWVSRGCGDLWPERVSNALRIEDGNSVGLGALRSEEFQIE